MPNTANTANTASTAIDIKLGLNMQIGSVPLSLVADVESNASGSVYTFSGCVQNAVIDIGTFISYVGQQFGIEVELPPELHLTAQIDYVAGQITYTKPTTGSTRTEMGAAAKFELIYSNGGKTETFGFDFYVDTILSGGGANSAYVFGAALDFDLEFKDLPLVGDVPVFKDYALKHLGFSYTNADPAQNNGKPVNFTLPKVSESANPLKTADAPKTKESTSYAIDSSGGKTTFNLAKKGFAFTAGLIKAGSASAESNFSLPMALPATPPPTTPATYYQADGAVKTSPPASAINWIKINKTFGPVDLQKIGLNYQNGEATFGLSAGFAMGGFSLAMQGLSITFPLPLPGMPAGNSVSFDLDGLAMDFQKDGLLIGGAFLKANLNGITNYFGEVAIQVSSFGFKAIGGYAPAQKGNPAAFFIYANLEIPLGGPPFLYVTGLAFGFGVNYSLNLPTIDNLAGYILLPGNSPQQPAKASDAFDGVLSQLAGGKNPVVTNQPGEYWVAAGVQFTSFNMVSAFALLTVSFGVDVQVGLLGSCAITLPKGAPDPLAYIEIDIVASFTPSSGLLMVAGVITPASYLWGGFVKMSGGFALNIWFSGEHSGDFVVSIGGYNDDYMRPTWYPAVPRLKLAYALGPFRAAGSAYLALTPAMFMAGMQFKATFSTGPVKAWFSCGVDFLISWTPFFYRADAFVNVGCSVSLGLFTIRVSVGADLKIWGPAFGGKADVDLDIVSFTIKFGSSAPNPAPISWQNIQDNFLPGATSAKPPPVMARSMNMLSMQQAAATKLAANTPNTTNSSVASASVAMGLLQQNVVDANARQWDWIVDPNNFQIVTATTIPANTANWCIGSAKTAAIPNVLADYDLPNVNAAVIPYLTLTDATTHFSTTQVWNPAVSVKPMKLANVQSIHSIALIKENNDGLFIDYVSALEIQPVLGNSNTALWGAPDAGKDVNTPTLLVNTLLGFNLLALPRNPDTVSNVPLIQLLFTMGNQTTFAYTAEQSDSRYQVTSSIAPPGYDLRIAVTGAGTESFDNQNYILGALANPWISAQRDTILNDLTANGFQTLTPSQLDLSAMASTEALSDWPKVGLLGALIAA